MTPASGADPGAAPGVDLEELRDVNDPGSMYHLWYDAGRDTLEGTYHQAAQQATYDVAFERQAR